MLASHIYIVAKASTYNLVEIIGNLYKKPRIFVLTT